MARELHVGDLVAKKDAEESLALVDRTYSDVDTHQPDPGRTVFARIRRDPAIKKQAFNKFMTDGVPPKGTVLVRWASSDAYQLTKTAKLTLVDRSLLIGDIVKKDVKDAMSGVVLNIFTICSLQPVCDLKINDRDRLRGLVPRPATDGMIIRPVDSGVLPALIDIPASELQYENAFEEQDILVYKSWLGRADWATYTLTIRLPDNCVVEVRDDLVRLVDRLVDFISVGDVVTAKKGILRQGNWIFGAYNPNTTPVGVVMQMRPMSLTVEWLHEWRGENSPSAEPPIVLERDEIESADFHIYDRTRRPKRGVSSATISNSELELGMSTTVRFRDLAGAAVKYDGSTHHGKLSRVDRTETLGYDLNVFEVTRFTSEVVVQWQDLSITREKSVNLAPDGSIDDEHAAWPGEIAHTLDMTPVQGSLGVEQPGKVGVVQNVDSAGRMATLRWCPNACLEYSVFTPDPADGVRMMITQRIGEACGETNEVSLYDVETPGQANVRRGDIVTIDNPRLLRDVSGEAVSADNGPTWLGEIVDTKLDGTLVVRLGAAKEVQDVTVKREDVSVAVRSDDVDALHDYGEENEEEDMDILMQLEDAGLGYPRRSDQDLGDDDEWLYDSDHDTSVDDIEDEDVDESSEDEEAQATYEDENGEPLDEDDVEAEEWESMDEDGQADGLDEGNHDTVMANGSLPTTQQASILSSPILRSDARLNTYPHAPEQYVLLTTPVPSSHHFASRLSNNASTHIKRTAREHRILSSPQSLPEGVYVRGWESRLDLLRVLFLGPTETPYAHAPFVIDFYLPPSFPADPPQAFFHSWTSSDGLGGVGRVNPNLYEDGKICLSLLGTWEGNKIEGWSSTRSTVLQVLVSVLGLVLVRQPYFNEAGYEHLVDAEGSKRPSALYNERAFLRSLTFVVESLRRLQSNTDGNVSSGEAIEGLEDVLRWLYVATDGPRLLSTIVQNITEILARSEKGAEESKGLHVMSKGACIPLRRAVERLRQFLM